VANVDHAGPAPGLLRRRFALKLQESAPGDLRPIFTEDGVTYVWVPVRVRRFPSRASGFQRSPPAGSPPFPPPRFSRSMGTCTCWR
jgi:hypothetical protein